MRSDDSIIKSQSVRDVLAGSAEEHRSYKVLRRFSGRAESPLLERLMSKVEVSVGCWNWTDCKSPTGYGKIKISGKTWQAHRAAYFLMVEEPPSDLVIDHKCRNRACVNPIHLQLVTQAVNNRLAVERRRSNGKVA